NSNTNKASLEGNIGFNDGIYGMGGGLSLTWEDDQTDVTLDDINGDGLVDLVVPGGNVFIVAFNTGNGFALGVPWQGGCNQEIATNSDIALGGGAYFTIAIGPLCLECCYIIINPGFNLDFSMSRAETALMDVNGDGYVDHVFSDHDNRLDVALNRGGRTNLLKKVIRPLGATITLQYERDGNTIDYPPSRWNLSRVEVFDGHPSDGVDKLVTTYSYQNPIYEPNERESYGYRTVIEEHRNAGNADAIYRTITRTYTNDNFYDKGLLERTLLQDSAGNKFIEQVNSYVLFDINTGAPIVFPDSTTATVFPQLVKSETYFYEGQPTAGKFTYVTYRYDSFGNIIEVFDAGDTGAEDDLLVTIDYFADLASYIVGKPNGTTVSSNGIELRRHEVEIQTGTGAVREVGRFLEDGQAAVTNLDYYPNGNLQRVTGPPNLHGERYVISLEYDPEVKTHIVSIEDSFGYRSTTASYDLSHGKRDVISDINGNQIDYDYDTFGRIRSIRGPYQTGSTDATLEFEYHPEAPVPWALTRHIDRFRDITDPIDTVTFVDGLKRVLQTKEDAAVTSNPGVRPEDVMIVSGRLTFDFTGRIIERYYPITEPLGTPGVFNAACDATTPTRTQYDVLDRLTKLTYPSGLFTTRDYGFGADRNNIHQFATLATDAKGIQKHNYSNVRSLITSIRETNNGGAEIIWTSYAYDALRQIVRIEDDMHNETRISYDNFGRRIVIDNPDTGKIEKKYDLADNLIKKITANLRSDSQAIEYDYEFNRLKSIGYPLFLDNNVSYDYGEPGAPFNRAGRIAQVSDQSGTEQRFYGKLGEIVKEIKTVASDTQGASANSPEVYTTEYTYDTWNRLQKLIYPDREEVTYRYDSGGLPEFARGVKDGFPTEYIRRLEYDKFRQQVYLETSNDVATRYEYDPVTRRLANLHAGGAGSGLFQNLNFIYDAVGNILETHNDVPVPPPSRFGGPVLQNYTYDDLRRLIEATGSHEYAPNKTDRYSFEINYDTIHNITGKIQSHE
ncbi:MAG: sugar-binding protein, partial [Candidatus Zixiibacteriota bacterium]